MIAEEETRHVRQWGEGSPDLKNGIDQRIDLSLEINRNERERRRKWRSDVSTMMDHIRSCCILVRSNTTRWGMKVFHDAEIEDEQDKRRKHEQSHQQPGCKRVVLDLQFL